MINMASLHGVIGILLAKDLLRYYAEESFEVRDMLRPAVFIPESKRLNVLLRDFRANRNHLAMVIDDADGRRGIVAEQAAALDGRRLWQETVLGAIDPIALARWIR